MEISKKDLRALEDTWYEFTKKSYTLQINNKVKDGMVDHVSVYTKCMNYETLLYCVKHLGVKE